MYGRAVWHGTKGMLVDKMLDPNCDFELWPPPWPWPLIFKVKFRKNSYLRNGMPDWHGTKGMWVDRILDPHWDFELWHHPWPWRLIFKVQFWQKRCNSGMGCLIDMERKGCESIGCWTHIVTLNCGLTHDLDPWVSRSNFEKVITQEWDARLTWNERDVNRLNVGPTLWLSTLTSLMTLTLKFQHQVLK